MKAMDGKLVPMIPVHDRIRGSNNGRSLALVQKPGAGIALGRSLLNDHECLDHFRVIPDGLRRLEWKVLNRPASLHSIQCTRRYINFAEKVLFLPGCLRLCPCCSFWHGTRLPGSSSWSDRRLDAVLGFPAPS